MVHSPEEITLITGLSPGKSQLSTPTQSLAARILPSDNETGEQMDLDDTSRWKGKGKAIQWNQQAALPPAPNDRGMSRDQTGEILQLSRITMVNLQEMWQRSYIKSLSKRTTLPQCL